MRLGGSFDFRHSTVWSLGVGVPLIIFLVLADPGSRPPPPAVPTSSLTPGGQLLAIVVAADFCLASHRAATGAEIRRFMDDLDEIAKSRGDRLITIGVAVDPDAAVGARFIAGLYEFDEIAAGNGWANHGALKYIWQEHVGSATIPQIILLHRELQVDTVGGLTVATNAERVLARAIGAAQIANLTAADVEFMVSDLSALPR